MPDAWYPKATRYPVGSAGSWAGGSTKRCTLHTTENTPETTTAMAVCKWMADNKSGSVYHIIYHPISGETVQMLPVSGSAKSLSNPSGGVETNRIGPVHIQISVVAQAKNPFTRYPMPGWSEIVDWITAWGVPRKWIGPKPAGKLDHVSNSFWNANSGWYGHCCVPENDHHDPGAVDLNKVLGAGSTAPSPTPPPTTGSSAPKFPLPSGHYFGPKSGPTESHSGYYNNDDDKFRPWQQRMKDRGWALTADGLYGPETEEVARNFQAEKGLAVDGLIGTQTWSTAWTAPVT